MTAEKTVIGWTEYIEFPDWGIKGIKAKIDTGARTSALHVEDLVIDQEGNAQFDVILNRKPPFRKIRVVAPIIKKAQVRSSTGEYGERCFVKTKIKVGELEKEIELSLISRKDMLFRMLIGRKSLESDFLVDVSMRYAVSKKPIKKKKKTKKS